MPAIPKPKKPKAKALAKQLDELVGALVRARGFCERCGSRKNLQWAHIVTRGAKQIRWDLDNALCLCSGCHYLFTNQSWRWPPFIAEKFGEEHWWDLHRRANTYKKIDHRALLENLLNVAKEISLQTSS